MLLPVNSTPGLWQSDQWSPGQPGLFAVVIGVSSYDHLDGGTAPVPVTYGLGQLEVSAITAYRFLRWLADKYKRNGAPLAQCWTLLAPTAKEIKLESALGDHALKPTMANCETAIGQWFASMNSLPLKAAQASRSVFLFSGHGLEILEDKQLLLPADYLSPPLSSVNNAVSTLNLARGLKALQVPRHFFFLDACRNDHDNLGNFSSLDGKWILNELKNSLNNPDCLVPLFYASAAGRQAYQPQDPAKETLFGRALLEGLCAQGLQPDCASGVCVVDLNRLEPFVRDRIVTIMRDDYKATSFQRVRLRGDHVADPVTEVPAPILPVAPPPPVAASLSEVRSLSVATPNWVPIEDSTTHHVFGSEFMTAIWATQSRVYDPQTKQWRPHGQGFVIDNVSRDKETRTFQLGIRIQHAKPGHKYWLEVTDLERKFGCLLLEDRSGNTVFRVELDLDYTNGSGGIRPLSRMDVSLSQTNNGLLGYASVMWDRYEQTNASAASNQMDPDLVYADDAKILEDFIAHKKWSPISAAVGTLILLRARQWEKLHNDWVRNLANWFPEFPDGAVLWTEQCLQQPQPIEKPMDALSYLLRLENGPLPLFGETLGYAARQVHVFLSTDGLSTAEEQGLQKIRLRLDRVLAWYRPGGLFATFAGPVNTFPDPDFFQAP